jgi:hypothetical protein
LKFAKTDVSDTCQALTLTWVERGTEVLASRGQIGRELAAAL